MEKVSKTDGNVEQMASMVLGGTHYDIGIKGNGRPVMGWTEPKKRGKAIHPQPVVDFLCHYVITHIEGDTMHGRTEVSIVLDGKKEIFRAHPNYRSDSNQRVNMWYDWAMFEYESSTGTTRILPGQILAIVEIGELKKGLVNQPKVRNYPLMPCKAYAVVRLFRREPKLKFRESTTGKQALYTYSVKWGQVRAGFFLLPLDKIVGTTIVVPNEEADPNGRVPCPSPLDGGFFVIPSRDQLGEDFLDVIERESGNIVGEEQQEEQQEEVGDGIEQQQGGDDEEESKSEDDDDSGISFIECRRVNYLRQYIENLNLE